MNEESDRIFIDLKEEIENYREGRDERTFSKGAYGPGLENKNDGKMRKYRKV